MCGVLSPLTRLRRFPSRHHDPDEWFESRGLDRGSEFQAAFEAACHARGIRLTWRPPRQSAGSDVRGASPAGRQLSGSRCRRGLRDRLGLPVGLSQVCSLHSVADPLEGCQRLAKHPLVEGLVGFEHDRANMIGKRLLQRHACMTWRAAGKASTTPSRPVERLTMTAGLSLRSGYRSRSTLAPQVGVSTQATRKRRLSDEVVGRQALRDAG